MLPIVSFSNTYPQTAFESVSSAHNDAKIDNSTIVNTTIAIVLYSGVAYIQNEQTDALYLSFYVFLQSILIDGHY